MKKIILIIPILITIFYFSNNYFSNKINSEKNIVNNLETVSEKNWLNFLQTKNKDFSILELNLNEINLSFWWVKINKISEFDKFDKFYAKDFYKNLSQENLQNKEIIATVNWQFFTNLEKKNTALSFPLKSNWKILTSYMDNEIPKRTLIIEKEWNAKILEWYSKKYLENIKNKEVIVAFTPEVTARRYASIWRTYIWLKDSKTLIFFIAKNKNQADMNDIIKNYWIKDEDIIMMDWWPSSQFSFLKNNLPWTKWEQFYGKWEVPHMFIIYKKTKKY